MAQATDLPSPFQMLQALYKSFTKLTFGSLRRLMAQVADPPNPFKYFKSFTNPFRRMYVGAAGASWLNMLLADWPLACLDGWLAGWLAGWLSLTNGRVEELNG